MRYSGALPRSISYGINPIYDLKNHNAMKKILSKNNLFILAVLSYVFIAPVVVVNAAKPDTLTFILVTDTHVCNLTGYHPIFVDKRQHKSKSIQTFQNFLKSVPDKLQADFVIITGDNIDYYEAETEKGGVLDTQVEQYSHLLDQSKVPIYLTLGNHDITSYWVEEDSSIVRSQIDAGRARAAWIRNVPCFKEGTYYSHVFRVDTTTFRLIFLDNGYYSTEENTDGVLLYSVDQYQLRWLDAQMKASPSDVEIIFMHLPLPFGKAAGNEILTEPISVLSSKTESHNLINVIEKNSSTYALFAGHNHINSINRYIYPNGGILTQILTGPLVFNSSNWRIIKLTNDKIIVSFPGNTKTEYIVPIR